MIDVHAAHRELHEVPHVFAEELEALHLQMSMYKDNRYDSEMIC